MNGLMRLERDAVIWSAKLCWHWVSVDTWLILLHRICVSVNSTLLPLDVASFIKHLANVLAYLHTHYDNKKEHNNNGNKKIQMLGDEKSPPQNKNKTTADKSGNATLTDKSEDNIKRRRFKRYCHGVKQYNKTEYSKITKRNFTKSKLRMREDKPTTRCKRSKTILESNIGTERTLQKANWINITKKKKKKKELRGFDDGHEAEIHLESFRNPFLWKIVSISNNSVYDKYSWLVGWFL